MTSTSGASAIIRRVAGAIVAALAAATATHVITVLLFFTANGANPSAFGQLSEYFLPSSLLLFLLLGVVAGLDGLRRWYVAVPLSLLAAVFSGLFGSLIAILNSGTKVDSAAVGFIFGTLVGPKLIFVIVAVVAATTIGRRLWSLITGSKLDVPPLRDRKVALVRLPAANLAEGQVTHIARSAVDAEKADEQWDGYVAALIENGWDTIEVPVAPEAPDSVFVEDTVVIFGETAVVTSPGHESRRAEIVAVEDTVRELGLRVARIQLPGTLDGGDVLKVGSTVYVGRGGRTNAEGIRQLRAIVAPLGYTVIAVPVTKVLHLKSGVTALPDGTVIGYPPLVDNPELFDRFLAVPEETGVAVVVLDDSTVLMAESAPKSAALVADLGYNVVTVDISEFEKLEGCVTCLSVRIR
ncbi:MAG: dimethylarginine dimethylaminohydrolase [Cryobacterium sp.]|jgi:dimethylargininase|nr:dimethylarginine dimethylaminohydrolase [Cryobacterium sp.]